MGGLDEPKKKNFDCERARALVLSTAEALTSRWRPLRLHFWDGVRHGQSLDECLLKEKRDEMREKKREMRKNATYTAWIEGEETTKRNSPATGSWSLGLSPWWVLLLGRRPFLEQSYKSTTLHTIRSDRIVLTFHNFTDTSQRASECV